MLRLNANSNKSNYIPYVVIIRSDENEFMENTIETGSAYKLPNMENSEIIDMIENKYATVIINHIYDNYYDDYEDLIESINNNKKNSVKKIKSAFEKDVFERKCKAFINKKWVNIDINYNHLYENFLSRADD